MIWGAFEDSRIRRSYITILRGEFDQ